MYRFTVAPSKPGTRAAPIPPHLIDFLRLATCGHMVYRGRVQAEFTGAATIEEAALTDFKREAT